MVIFLLTTAAAGFLLGVAGTRLEGAAAGVLTVAVLVLWVGLVGWRCVAPPLVRWLTTHFIVTDRRVLVRQGVITHTGIDIPMGRISNVQFRHGIVDRMLHTGTLVIVSAADDPLEFDDIPDVQTVHTLLYQQAFDGRSHRGGYATGDKGGYPPTGEYPPGDRGGDSSGRKAW